MERKPARLFSEVAFGEVFEETLDPDDNIHSKINKYFFAKKKKKLTIIGQTFLNWKLLYKTFMFIFEILIVSQPHVDYVNMIFSMPILLPNNFSFL